MLFITTGNLSIVQYFSLIFDADLHHFRGVIKNLRHLICNTGNLVMPLIDKLPYID